MLARGGARHAASLEPHRCFAHIDEGLTRSRLVIHELHKMLHRISIIRAGRPKGFKEWQDVARRPQEGQGSPREEQQLVEKTQDFL